MKGICQDTIIGSFVDYHKKILYARDRFTLGLKAFCPKIY